MSEKENNVFQTGSTKPPKSRQGLIALLLVLVVLLGGMVCALSMMNVQLFQMLEDSQEAPEEADDIRFFQNTDPNCNTVSALREGVELQQLGIIVQDLSSVYRQYQNLPEGLFILEVGEGPARRANIRAGDILVAVNGICVDTAWLDRGSAMASMPDQPVLLTVMRDGTRLTIPLILGG